MVNVFRNIARKRVKPVDLREVSSIEELEQGQWHERELNFKRRAIRNVLLTYSPAAYAQLEISAHLLERVVMDWEEEEDDRPF